MKKNCARAEILAGALALGEATDAERDEYRRHIAVCSSCLNAIGGEREIERTMELVSAARDSEMWEPVLTAASIKRTHATRVWGVGLSAAAVALVASLGIHLVIASQIRPVTIAQVREPNPPVPTMHVTIERRAPKPPAPVPKPTTFEPSIVVVHNVITLKRAQTTVVAESVPFKSVPASNVPVWRRDEPLNVPSHATTVAMAPLMQGRAESLVVAPVYSVRDVAPLGGDTAINPRPPMIAYAMGAEGTTAFEVTVDDRGVPQKCTITKPSGYLVLDRAVCKAAMQARFSPRLVNGRAVSGVYRDAFTFRSQNNSDNQL
ncbi:MAG TPA: TonB family protein [Candidatus Baltobacteraceae bacterium]|nr:TonB family protein [Candidatus Baltobacteraceae bacterium]